MIMILDHAKFINPVDNNNHQEAALWEADGHDQGTVSEEGQEYVEDTDDAEDGSPQTLFSL